MISKLESIVSGTGRCIRAGAKSLDWETQHRLMVLLAW